MCRTMVALHCDVSQPSSSIGTTLLVMIVRLCLCCGWRAYTVSGRVVCAVGCSFLPFVVADEESAHVCTLVLFFFNIHVCIDY